VRLTAMSHLCELDIKPNNQLNGIDIDYDDFGEKYDRDRGSAEPYGCGDMQFTRKQSTEEVLKKYDITEEYYSIICDQLEDILSFGGCGWCV
jgi:hypothetical protein